MPTGAFNICCPRDCVSRHNGGTSGTPLKPLRVDSALNNISNKIYSLPPRLEEVIGFGAAIPEQSTGSKSCTASRKIFPLFFSNQLESDCVYHFSVDLKPNVIPFGLKSFGKWLIQSDFDLILQNSEKISL